MFDAILGDFSAFHDKIGDVLKESDELSRLIAPGSILIYYTNESIGLDNFHLIGSHSILTPEADKIQIPIELCFLCR